MLKKFLSTVALCGLVTTSALGQDKAWPGGGSSGSGGTPAGASNSVQYNNGGAFGGVGPGTTSTVLHGNASGAPSYGAVALGTDVSGILGSANGGAGSVSGIMQANGSGTVAAATLGNGLSYSSPKLSLTNTLNTQTGTSYAVASTDAGAIITASNASAQAYTIVQANTAGFTSGFGTTISNIGAGTVTLTATTSTFGNALTTLVIAPGQIADIGSDGTNYPFSALSLPVIAQDTVLGNPAAANYPIAMTMPACANDGAHGLVYASHAFACASITGGVASSVTVGTTTISGGTSGRVEYNNAGVLGEMTTTGSGTVLALATSPVFTTPNIGAATGTQLDMSGTSTSSVNLGGSGAIKVGGTSKISFSGGSIFLSSFTAWGSTGGGVGVTATSGTVPGIFPDWTHSGTGIGSSGANILDLIANSTDMVRVATTGMSMVAGVFTLKGFTVSTLPAGPATGSMAYVTDQTAACSYGATPAGSGSNTCKVWYNGASWIDG